MVEISKIKTGDKVIWRGSGQTKSYGNRNVEAIVMLIKDENRIQIKIQTPRGEMIKFVSKNSLDYFNGG